MVEGGNRIAPALVAGLTLLDRLRQCSKEPKRGQSPRTLALQSARVIALERDSGRWEP